MISFIILATRVVVFALFGFAAVVAGTHWAVQHGHIKPFGPVPTTIRSLGQPILRLFERRLYRGGGNPVSAPYLFFWVALLGGLALLGLVQWLIGTLLELAYSASAGPRALLGFVISGVFSILMLALFVRVISSWFGVSPYSRLMRVVHALTDWLLDPLRRILPPFGMIDVSPIVAYLMLSLARWVLLRQL